LLEIEELNKRNYAIDEEFLNIYQDIFDKYDNEIVTESYRLIQKVILQHTILRMGYGLILKM